MDWQTILVGLVIFVALFYASKQILAKARSFSPKNDCGSNCGCGDGARKIPPHRR